MRKAVVALVVLVLVLVALDRVGWVVTNYALEGALKSQLHLDKKPKVRVHGIPFLTQVVGGKYGNVEVRATNLTSGRVQDIDADVHLHGVHVPVKKLASWNVNTVPIDHARAEVTVPYGELARLSGVPGLTARAKGKQVVLTAPLAGIGTVTATATPKVTGNVVSVTPDAAQVDGRAVSSALVQRLSYRLPLDALPFQLELTGLRVTSAGLVGTATADDITVRRGELVPLA